MTDASGLLPRGLRIYEDGTVFAGDLPFVYLPWNELALCLKPLLRLIEQETSEQMLVVHSVPSRMDIDFSSVFSCFFLILGVLSFHAFQIVKFMFFL